MFYFTRFILIILILFTAGCVSSFDKTSLFNGIAFTKNILQKNLSFSYYNLVKPGNRENVCSMIKYKVKPGDTFYSIYCENTTRMFSYDEFISLNGHIKNVDTIEPGDSVYLPAGLKNIKKDVSTLQPGEKLPLVKKEFKKSTGAKFLIYMVKINPLKYKISLYHNKGITVEDIKKDRKVIAAINGGFFAPGENFSPIGLLMSKGKKINPLTDYWDYSGVFYITSAQSDPYGICKKESFYDTDVTEAIQSFPILVWNGSVYKEYKDREEASRSAIAIDKDGNILLIATESTISGGLTLNEFAFAINSMNWNCQKALNLDGGSSTQMYVKDLLTLHSTAGIIGQDKVSNFIVFSEK
jgi:exopolysaccharide biosynthesis protein